MISIKNLSKKFDDTIIMENLSMNVKKKSIYGLVGVNGAGKTTLIKMLTGIIKPDNGEILFEGEQIFENIFAKNKIGYVSDDVYFFNLYNLKKMAKFYEGVYNNWSWERYDKLVKYFSLDEKRNLNKFSKGMRKQAAIVLTISTMPELLVLDEPIDGLDPLIRKKVLKVILDDVAARDMSVLISSHNLRELEGICDTIGIINDGTMVLERNIEDMESELFKIQVAFNGEMPMKLKENLEILSYEKAGKVELLVVKGNYEEINEKINKFNPIILDALTLTLEERFIYEVGGFNYDIDEIIF